jgi:hypothetical protein
VRAKIEGEMINISFTHIIADKRRIEYTSSKVFYAKLSKQECQNFSEVIKLAKVRTYTLVCGRYIYEIICPAIQAESNIYLIVPEFLALGRPYPVYVYLYGILLYSSNPEIGQREAAEKTRVHFDLETFSHTTLGRAMIRLETHIKAFENSHESKGTSCAGNIPDAHKAVTRSEITEAKHSNRFPSVEDTHKRRDTVISFLSGAAGKEPRQLKDIIKPTHIYKRPPYEGAFFDMCHRIVDYIFIKHRSLLL